jgi:hypothetical protein
VEHERLVTDGRVCERAGRHKPRGTLPEGP